jgi:diamine N-acetyltransferase
LEIGIREATTADLPAIADLFVEIHQFHVDAEPEVYCAIPDPSELTEYVSAHISDENVALLLAEFNGRIAGFIVARVLEAPDHAGMVARQFVSIENVGVTDECRGQGAGRALMAAAEEWTKSRDVREMQLSVREFNEGARDLYHGLGYKTASRRMSKTLQ